MLKSATFIVSIQKSKPLEYESIKTKHIYVILLNTSLIENQSAENCNFPLTIFSIHACFMNFVHVASILCKFHGFCSCCIDFVHISCVFLQVSVDGGWSDWSSWSECNVTCGLGSSVRSRLCDQPTPINDGTPCQGQATEVKQCTRLCQR